MQAHIVPRIYLKGFADVKRGGIGVYSIAPDTPSYFVEDVKRVATKEDFYVLYAADKTPDPNIEEAFCAVESQLRDALKYVRSNREPDSVNLQQLAFFAALQEGRSERSRLAFAPAMQHITEVITQEMRKSGLAEAQIEAEVSLFMKKHFAGGDVHHSPTNIALLAVPDATQIRYTFFKHMSKCIVRSNAHDFLTADHPVAWFDPFRGGLRRMAGDFLSLSAEVTYPLTKRHCLFMSYFPLPTMMNANADMVQIINARTAGNALAEVYASPKLSDIDHGRDRDDILAVDKRQRSLMQFLSIEPDTSAMADIAAIADELGIDRQYILELNKPLFEIAEQVERAQSSTV